MKEKKKNRKPLLIITCLFIFVFIVLIILPAILPYKPPKNIVCATNVKSLSICFLVYQMDEKTWPVNESWCDLIKPYTDYEDRNIFLCRADKTGPCSYAMNENIPADANELPDDLVLLFESAPGWNQTGGPDDVITDRHGEKNPGANIAFADGHVEFVKAEDIPTLSWTVDEQ